MQYRFLRFPQGKSKVLTLSYDDGSKYDIRLAQILNRHGIKCTFNLTNAVVDAKPGGYHITAEEICEHLLDKGHEIAVHTANHVAPGQTTTAMGIKQVLDCRLALEEKFGRIIKGLAYPNAGITQFTEAVTVEQICSYLKDLGIAYARTLGKDNNLFFIPNDWYRWMPTCHHDNPHLMQWLEEFKSVDTENGYYAGRYPRLFYLWGHSNEFESKGHWDIIEKFCESAVENEDIWFATNMEICNYIKAYHSLQWSADEKMVYNPTAQKIWFICDDHSYCIAPDETLKLL